MADELPQKAKGARRIFHRDMAVAGALYIALIIVGVYAIRHFSLPQWLVVALAIAPLAPVALMLRAYLTRINAMDEFQQRLHMRAAVIAGAVVAFGAFAYGLLQDLAGFPALSIIWVLPAFGFAWSGSLWLVRQRYK